MTPEVLAAIERVKARGTTIVEAEVDCRLFAYELCVVEAKLRIAESVRDDAQAQCNRRLEELRQAKLEGAEAAKLAINNSNALIDARDEIKRLGKDVNSCRDEMNRFMRERDEQYQRAERAERILSFLKCGNPGCELARGHTGFHGEFMLDAPLVIGPPPDNSDIIAQLRALIAEERALSEVRGREMEQRGATLENLAQELAWEKGINRNLLAERRPVAPRVDAKAYLLGVVAWGPDDWDPKLVGVGIYSEDEGSITCDYSRGFYVRLQEWSGASFQDASAGLLDYLRTSPLRHILPLLEGTKSRRTMP